MVSLVKKQRCRSNISYYTLYLLHKIQWCRTTPLFKVWLRRCVRSNPLAESIDSAPFNGGKVGVGRQRALLSLCDGWPKPHPWL
ncbi:hypothetical protein Hanom_Chr16g01422251 [Helianthus anomalus]